MAVPPLPDITVCRRAVQRLAALTGRRCTGRDPALSRTTPPRRSPADRKDRAAQVHRRRAPWNPSTPNSGQQRQRASSNPSPRHSGPRPQHAGRNPSPLASGPRLQQSHRNLSPPGFGPRPQPPRRTPPPPDSGRPPQRPRSNPPPPRPARHRTRALQSMLALRWRRRRSRRMRRLGDRDPVPRRRCARRSLNLAVRLTTRRLVSPGRRSCPCATGRRPVGPSPRSGQVEMRLGPAWVRYRETATPETDPPSAFHRPVLIPGRHRARPSRLRVTLPRCRPCPWCPPAAMPTSPTYPARVRLRLRGPQVAAAEIPARRGACSGIRPGGLPAPAVLHRDAE
jgi:hypothetical protein